MRLLILALAFAPTTVLADPAAFPRPMPYVAATPPQPIVAAAEPEASVTVAPVAEYAREYGERNVREIGASAGFMIAPRFHSVTIAPSFGWFLADNVQLSTIVSLTSIKAGADTSTIATATLEPSYHYRVDNKLQLFGGMGFGYSYIRELGHGLTYTVRAGSQFLIGKKGVFTPSISYDFRSNKQDEMDSLAAVASEAALRINLGYTTLF